MVRILGSTGTRRRRTWLALGTAAALTFLAIPATSFANLAGSTFEGNDGNLVVNTSGNTDWVNVAGLHAGIDLASGNGDNSFGQGTKEDDANVTVVSGSIPPQKSDLTRFYEASESVSGQTFLYLAWERTNVLGSANMDFEINQAVTPNLGSPGPHTINRTAGDLLVTYDFTNGGTKPTLGLNTWLTSTTTPLVPGFATNVCLSSNKFPCWGDHIDLNATNSEGAINTVTVTDPIAPNAPRSLAALTFGEAAINLTGAGVFPPGTCKAFGSAFLKSRASASFPAEVKDFVAPVPVNISNCGRVTIIKHTDPRGIDQNFSYSSTLAGTNMTCTTDTTPASFTLNDSGNTTGDSTANTEDCTNVPVGSYTVTEGAEPSGFVLESLTCTAGGEQDATIPEQANITVTADSHVTCTYVNQQQLGAIKITKTAKNKNLGSGDQPQQGVTFTIAGTGGPYTVVTGANGVACQEGLAFGSYTVTETVPSGYQADSTNPQTVSVGTSAACGSGDEALAEFHNTPLSQIRVTFHSKAGVGVTTATIKCTGEASETDLPDGISGTGHTLDDLVPGTYSCEVVIDP